MTLPKEKQIQIDNEVVSALEETGLTYPESNLLDIAEKLGVKVFYTDFSEFKENSNKIGGLIKWNDEPIAGEGLKANIYLNKDYSPERQRFTLAHELGHFILHKGSDKWRIDLYDYSQNSEESMQETEANYFAGNLLMPKSEFEKILKVSNGDLDITSKYFGVSRSAVEVRLQWIQDNKNN